MSLLTPFFPAVRLASWREVRPEWMKERKLEGIIFDIDNTLVGQDAPLNEEVRTHLDLLKAAGIRCLFLSNNREERVRPFADAVGCRYLCKARKPARSGYAAALRLLELTAEKTAVVGDQLFTDMFGANRSGILSVLVAPVSKKDCLSVRIKRIPEKIVLFFYERQQKCLKFKKQ